MNITLSLSTRWTRELEQSDPYNVPKLSRGSGSISFTVLEAPLQALNMIYPHEGLGEDDVVPQNKLSLHTIAGIDPLDSLGKMFLHFTRGLFYVS